VAGRKKVEKKCKRPKKAHDPEDLSASAAPQQPPARIAGRKPTLARWREPFLAVLADTGNVAEACRVVKIDRATFYRAVNRYERFAAQVAEARKQAVILLEDEAWRRSLHCDSDRLLIFLLKALKPDVYGSMGNVTVSGPDGGPLRHAIGPDRDTMVAYSQDPEALSAMAILASKSAALQLAAEDDEADE